jgi:uncharacterized protein YabE (DUF348 family)
LVRPTRVRRLRVQRAIRGVTFATGTLLVAGTLFFAITKSVTLVVKGQPPETISTTSSNVQDLLTGEGISLTARVLVEPPATTPLADGMTVHVTPAPGAPRPVGGSNEVGVWAVEGTSSGHAANAALLAGASASVASAGPSSAVPVQVDAEGKVRDVWTNGKTVEELLSAMGISTDADDRVSPPPSTPLQAGLEVEIASVFDGNREIHSSIPFGVRVLYTTDLPAGEIRVLRPGRPGLEVRMTHVRAENGEVLAREPVRSWIQRQPVTEIRLAGEGTPSADIAMAPEPGARAQRGLASWYDPPWTGLTAAHPTIPLGTLVTVTDVDTGRSVTVVIDDRGPFSPGKVIDLSPEAFSVLSPLGRGVLHVQLTW